MVNVWTAIAHTNQLMTYALGRGATGNALGIAGSTTYPEVFNGTAWTTQAGNNGVQDECHGISNTTTSVLCFNYGYCELWNGSTWITKSGIAYYREPTGQAGSGSSTTAAIFALFYLSNYNTYTYDGTSWTNKSASHATTPYNMVGTESSALLLGSSTITKLWNGTAWSAGGNRVSGNGKGLSGSSSAGISAGAHEAQSYSGTTWSGESAPPATMFAMVGMAGDASDAILFGANSDWSAGLAFRFQAQVLEAPVANFSGTPTSGLAPLTVVFTDLSTNLPTSWNWVWGDGDTPGTTQNPTHIYASAGTYTVTLTATNAYGTDDEAKVAYIVVNSATPPYDPTLAVGDRVMITPTRGKPVAIKIQ